MSELQYMPQLNVDYFKSLDKLDSLHRTLARSHFPSGNVYER
jgi:hypothetical protein